MAAFFGSNIYLIVLSALSFWTLLKWSKETMAREHAEKMTAHQSTKITDLQALLAQQIENVDVLVRERDVAHAQRDASATIMETHKAIAVDWRGEAMKQLELASDLNRRLAKALTESRRPKYEGDEFSDPLTVAEADRHAVETRRAKDDVRQAVNVRDELAPPLARAEQLEDEESEEFDDIFK